MHSRTIPLLLAITTLSVIASTRTVIRATDVERLAPASLAALVEADSIQSYLNRLQAFNGRVSGTDSVYAARDWINAKFHSFGYDSVYNDSFSAPVSGGDRPCYNVVAVRTGDVYPDIQIVVGAHYDAVPGSPGADDNGTGTCGVLELARVLRNLATDVTVVFVTFDAHEWGIYGSTHYAEDAYVRGDQILVMLNLDMLGYLPNSGEALLLYGPDDRYARIWADSGGPSVAITGHPVPSYYNVDHYPFIQRGYHGVFVFENEFSSVHHTFRDSTSYINFDYAARMTGATLACISVIANSDMDADGVTNQQDNCVLAFNPLQEDLDQDNLGDACDPCACLCHGDPACDSVIADILDVVNTVNVAFRNAPPVTDPSPYCLREATDVDCSGTTDVIDVVKTVNVAFRNANPATEYCEPCSLPEVISSRDSIHYFCYPIIAVDTFTLANVGTTAADFTLTTAADWLSFDPASGNLPPASTQLITATAHCTAPPSNQTWIFVRSQGIVTDSIYTWKEEVPVNGQR